MKLVDDIIAEFQERQSEDLGQWVKRGMKEAVERGEVVSFVPIG
jgi:DNA invertase Pin-like site-specific DNA recombinase